MNRFLSKRLLIVSMMALLWQGGTAVATPAAHQPQFDDAVAAYEAGNFPRAFQLWQTLAAESDPAVLRNLGHMLRRGLGVPRDEAAAFAYYKQAAQLGLPTAQLNLADAYETGMGTKSNLTEARYWAGLAAKAGHPLAQYRYGKLLADGSGGPTKPDEALIYLTAALQAGVPQAADTIEQVMQTLYPTLSEGQTPDE